MPPEVYDQALRYKADLAAREAAAMRYGMCRHVLRLTIRYMVSLLTSYCSAILPPGMPCAARARMRITSSLVNLLLPCDSPTTMLGVYLPLACISWLLSAGLPSQRWFGLTQEGLSQE
jgi:hypothetical protein